MNLEEFKKFVATNPDYEYKDNRVRKVAEVLKEFLGQNKDPTIQAIANELGWKPVTVQIAISRFYPKELKEENLEKEAMKLSVPPPKKPTTIERGNLAEKQIQASLGESYAKGIEELSKHYGWFAEALMGIGRIAFEAYLMNLDVSPEETDAFLSRFNNPKELIDGFQTFFIGLLKFRVGASEMENLLDQLDEYKMAVEYGKTLIQRYRAIISEQQRMLSMLMVSLPPKKIQQIMDTLVLSNVPLQAVPFERPSEEVGEA